MKGISICHEGFEKLSEEEITEILKTKSTSIEPFIVKFEAEKKDLEKLAYKNIDKGDIAHNVITSIAHAVSRGSIKLSSSEEVEDLFARLFQCAEHMYSPKGKKILETIETQDLLKILD